MQDVTRCCIMLQDDAVKENSYLASDCRTFLCPLVSGGPSDLDVNETTVFYNGKLASGLQSASVTPIFDTQGGQGGNMWHSFSFIFCKNEQTARTIRQFWVY